MDEIDIWRAAGTLLKRFGGERAALTAAMRADQLLDKNDIEGFTAWKRIVSAINELERTKPSGAERIN